MTSFQFTRKRLTAPLSDDLVERYKVKSFAVRKGDSVKIVRGDFAGIEGKVTEVDRGTNRLFIEGVTREKVSGKQTKVSVDSSKVLITNLNLDDKWRADALGKGKEEEKPPEAPKEGE